MNRFFSNFRTLCFEGNVGIFLGALLAYLLMEVSALWLTPLTGAFIGSTVFGGVIYFFSSLNAAEKHDGWLKSWIKNWHGQLLIGGLSLLGLFIYFYSRSGDESALFWRPYSEGLRYDVMLFWSFTVALLNHLIQGQNLPKIFGVCLWMGVYWVAPWYAFFNGVILILMSISGFLGGIAFFKALGMAALMFLTKIAATMLGNWFLVAPKSRKSP